MVMIDQAILDDQRPMRRVVLESPYAADTPEGVQENVDYLHRCALDCLRRGEAPIASHGWFARFLDDKLPAERALGIRAGLSWVGVASAMVVYVDRGVSRGMRNAMAYADQVGVRVEVRRLDKTLP